MNQARLDMRHPLKSADRRLQRFAIAITLAW
jgi:hypothetical protein